MTRPLPFSWPNFLVFWSVYAWVFFPEIRILRRATRGTAIPPEDRGSLRVITIAFSVAVFAAFLLPFAAPWAALPGSPLGWFGLGVGTLIVGSLLRRHCFWILGSFFTGAITIQTDHRVVDSGAYRWVRHPSYSAALMIVLGIGLSTGNWLSVLASLAVVFPAYDYRARVEEQALLSSLGSPYAAFMASRRRFIPHVY